MKFHRVKHIPTGLYYKPYMGSSNLASIGKIYTTNSSPLVLNKEEKFIYISIRSNSVLLKKFPNAFPELEFDENRHKYCGYIPKSKFEIEYLD